MMKRYSENYIFGKFDAFTKRLEKVISLNRMMNTSADADDVRVEGLEEINEKFKALVENIKKKGYDCLDYRRPEVKLKINSY